MKKDFIDYICRPFCRYFREGDKEDMECGGALAVFELVKRDIININDIPSSGKDPSLWNDDDIRTAVCCSCGFRKEDCDFASDNPPAGCEPCGGYILLSILRRNGIIDSEEIR